MSYLQHEHVEKCYYQRDDTDYLIRTKKHHLLSDLTRYIEEPSKTFLELPTQSYTEYTRQSYLTVGNEVFLSIEAPKYSSELSNRTQYLETSKAQFYSVDPDPQHLLYDLEHHVEEDGVNHVEEDRGHHLEESDGETSDDENEDFCHLIDFNTRLPPEWERKENPKTNLIEYYDKLTNSWQENKPPILERFEVFDLTEEELIIALARYNHGNSAQLLKQYRREKGGMHRSSLQPVVLEALRVWKHEVESRVLHSGVMAANYEDKKHIPITPEERLTAAERKQQRLEALRRQEDDRYKVLEQQRKLNLEKFNQRNQARMNQISSQRQKISQERQDKFSALSDEQRRKKEQLESNKLVLEAERDAEEKERLQKDKAKEHEIKILNLLTEFTTGFSFDNLPSMYVAQFSEDWEPHKWFNNSNMENDLHAVFRSMHLKDEVVILRSGYTNHVMHQKHYAKLQIQGFSNDEILDVMPLCNSVDEIIKKIKAEKVAAKEAQANQTNRQRQQSTPKRRETRRGSTKAKQGSVSRPKSPPPVPAFLQEDPGLPPFWEAKKTAKGKIYFINHQTKSTTWEDPRPLPSGWRSGKNAKGRTYYINDIQKKTQWDDPRPPIRL